MVCAVIRKYLHHGFDEDNEAMNVSLAAEEVYGMFSRFIMFFKAKIWVFQINNIYSAFLHCI